MSDTYTDVMRKTLDKCTKTHAASIRQLAFTHNGIESTLKLAMMEFYQEMSKYDEAQRVKRENDFYNK